MNIKTITSTVTGIVIALIITLVFNISYWLTTMIVNDKVYALNMGIVSIAIILIAVIIDIIKSIHVEYKKPPEPNDLPTKGIVYLKNTEYPPEPLKSEPELKQPVPSTLQEVENIGQKVFEDEMLIKSVEADSASEKSFEKILE